MRRLIVAAAGEDWRRGASSKGPHRAEGSGSATPIRTGREPTDRPALVPSTSATRHVATSAGGRPPAPP